MPPKGKTKAGSEKLGFLGKLNVKRKNLTLIENKILDIDNAIINKEDIIFNKQKQLNEKEEELKVLQHSINEIDKKINNKKRTLLNRKLQLLQCSAKSDQTTSKIQQHKAKYLFKISKSVSLRRKCNPTTKETPLKAKYIRRKETYDTCLAIHGATKEITNPLLEGVLDMLTAKIKSKILIPAILNTKPSFVSPLTNTIIKNWCDNYYKSDANILRSINTFYCQNVIGKTKYISIRQANKNLTYIPNYIPYKDLADNINKVDIGELIPIHPTLTYGDLDCYTGDGVFRDCSFYIPRLAQFLLTANRNRVDKLISFPNFSKKDDDSYLLLFTFGGDGAPISGTTFLTSFLNVGERIASSTENYLLFGANVSENSTVCRRFIAKFLHDVKYLESKVFVINVMGVDVKVEFKLTELPNDMKMVAFLGGELSNAAYYFCTFANVNSSNFRNIKNTFGNSSSDDWHPFNYDKRVSDANKVAAKKNTIKNSNISLGYTTHQNHFLY